MRIRYLGHSCFYLEAAGKRFVFDPFVRQNPAAPQGLDIATLPCDYILVSHGHDDHSSDAEPFARAHGAQIVSNFEITEYFAARGLKTIGLNPGGACRLPFGRIKLTLAHHSSSFEGPGGPIYMGSPCGIVLEIEGRRIYHAGDTALFLDMQLIGRGGLDLAMIPIGDTFTMGPDDALDALDFLKPTLAIPMHYNTWPPIMQDAHDFERRAAERGHRVRPLKPGEWTEF